MARTRSDVLTDIQIHVCLLDDFGSDYTHIIAHTRMGNIQYNLQVAHHTIPSVWELIKVANESIYL